MSEPPTGPAPATLELTAAPHVDDESSAGLPAPAASTVAVIARGSDGGPLIAGFFSGNSDTEASLSTIIVPRVPVTHSP